VSDQLVELFEGPLIQEQVDALAGRELSFLVLPGPPLVTAASFRRGMPAA
jgi:hypothetical protein